MIAVILDTNAVHSDPWLAGAPGRKLLDLAARGACVILYPQVVIEELSRQRREAAQLAHKQAASGLDDMAKAGIDVTQTAAHLQASFEKISTDLSNAFDAVLGRPSVAASPVPDVAVAEILRRDLAQRRPFVEVQTKQRAASLGFRDTLIWETVLAVLKQRGSSDTVIFVTADKGFLSDDSKSLHQDLLADLDDRQIDRERVRSVKNIPNAIVEVEAAATLRAAQVAAATDALYELTEKEISLSMGYGGDYDYPEFVQFEVPPLESAFIGSIDQTSEFEIAQDPATGSAIATADAILTIEGAVFMGDWFADEGETMTVVGELNDHYFEASSEVTVQVVVDLDMSSGSPEVQSIVLRPAQVVSAAAP